MHQIIYFGTAGVGKSYKVEQEIICEKLGLYHENGNGKYTIQDNIYENKQVDVDYSNCIKTVFHPEYTYRDFMVKLSPMTTIDGKVRYEHHEGDFLKALAKAYKNILEMQENKSPDNVALVIDEINRGNSAEIFGTVFQLLDREDDGWSSYPINLSNMEFDKLIELVFGEQINETIGNMTNNETQNLSNIQIREKAIKQLVTDEQIKNLLSNKQIKLPPNLSIIATMNTSDESIYYMDSAFKRRWDWKYIDISSNNNQKIKDLASNSANIDDWRKFIDNLNSFIKSNSKSIRKVEDKLIGYWFIKNHEEMTNRPIQNKLMFFLWDNVFARDKKPLKELLGKKDNELITFGDFTLQVNNFIEKIKAYGENV
jgi:5-methylcytosine-specific restriction endonuclease McrBC GTP-binding regulatory subunit McrB